jgi:hypothetical protein
VLIDRSGALQRAESFVKHQKYSSGLTQNGGADKLLITRSIRMSDADVTAVGK